jgi:fructokinase
MPPTALRIGIDLGGTKIEGVVIDSDERVLVRERIATPRHDYVATVAAIVDLAKALAQHDGAAAPVGIGTPGAWDPVARTMKNCNSTWLNGRALLDDIEAQLGRKVRIANDADCLAVSEARNGAARGAQSVFGVILGTGVGGGIVVHDALVTGPNAIAGEWGHTPLPYFSTDSRLPDDLQQLSLKLQRRACYCGRDNCVETFLSGPGLARIHRELWNETVDVAQLGVDRSRNARTTLELYAHFLARSLAQIINVLDPYVIVLGGGVSNLEYLYTRVPELWGSYVFSPTVHTMLRRAALGDSSGVLGAAGLWPRDYNLRTQSSTQL